MKKATIPLLSIAGYEASGQMGVLADLRVFESYGFSGLGVRTATTEQFGSVPSLLAASPCAFSKELCELPVIEYLKVGMLPTAPLVNELANWLEQRPGVCVVHDPVRYSSTGLALASPESFLEQRKRLLPLASVITPNAREAAELADVPVPTNKAEAAEVAARLFERMRGDAIVVITGVNSENGVADTVLTKDGVTFLGCPLVRAEKRGTGCRYSSTLLCALAAELPLMEALSRAQAMVVAYLRA